MKKPVIRILLSLLLVAVVAVGGTFAYLMATDSPLLNTFTLAEVETKVDEPESGTASDKKADVQNTGSVAGNEIVQLYMVSPDHAALERPEKTISGRSCSGSCEDSP